MDDRLKLLSYSFQSLLHSCPRKYQLSRLRATEDESDPLSKMNQNLTFAFGHIVGSGIQDVMLGLDEDKVIWNMFLAFHAELYDRNDKQAKSFWHAVQAVQRFIFMRSAGFLNDYELVYYQGKPAVELSFLINMPDGFKMRGSVDVILKHKVTGAIRVLECKTTSATQVNPNTYRNSSQAIGYSIVLDVIFPQLGNYEVLYLVYSTKTYDYELIPFSKSHTQKAMWIQELLLDVEIIKLYDKVDVWPMNGNSCLEWFRECEYLQTCTLATKHLTNEQTEADKGETNSTYTGEYTITLSLVDLISGQLDNNAREEEIRLANTHTNIVSGTQTTARLGWNTRPEAVIIYDMLEKSNELDSLLDQLTYSKVQSTNNMINFDPTLDELL